MRAYMHAHPCSLFKLEEKQLVDRSLKMLIICLSQIKGSKVGFLCSVLFYSHLNCVLFGFVAS